MAYYIALIGEPVGDRWWHRNIESGFISAGYEGKPQRARDALLSFAEGDWLFAYAKPFGFVGAGVTGSADSYEFVSDSEVPSDFESTHRHFRSVHWQYVIPTLADAVKWRDAGRRPLPKTVQPILDAEIGRRVLQTIAQRAKLVAPDLQERPLRRGINWRHWPAGGSWQTSVRPKKR